MPGSEVNQSSLNDQSSMASIALSEAGLYRGEGVLNGIFIFALVSASISSLYIASRVLYGMALTLETDYSFVKWIRKWLTVVHPSTKVPIFAIVLSGFALCWLPFLSLDANSEPLVQLIEVLASSTSVCAMVTWSSICIAYISFKHQIDHEMKRIRKRTEQEPPTDQAEPTERADQPEVGQEEEQEAVTDEAEEAAVSFFNCRGTTEYKAQTFLYTLQPIPAYLGLAGSIMIIVFTTSTFWDREVNVGKLAVSIGPLLVQGVLFVLLKIWRRVEPQRRRTKPSFLQKLLELEKWRVREEQGPPYRFKDIGKSIKNWFSRSGGEDVEMTVREAVLSAAPSEPSQPRTSPPRYAARTVDSRGSETLPVVTPLPQLGAPRATP